MDFDHVHCFHDFDHSGHDVPTGQCRRRSPRAEPKWRMGISHSANFWILAGRSSPWATWKTRRTTSPGGRPPSTRPKQRLLRRPTTTEPLCLCMPYAEWRPCSWWWSFTLYYAFAWWKGIYGGHPCCGEFILQVDSENKRSLQEVFAINHCNAQGWDQKPYVEARWRCAFTCLAHADPLSWSLYEEGWLGRRLEKDRTLRAGALALLATSWRSWSSSPLDQDRQCLHSATMERGEYAATSQLWQ